MNCLVLLVLVFLQYNTKCHGGYYWRDYEKEIPFDAYSAGETANNENVYIGQALLNENDLQGVYPTSIIAGKGVWVPRVGARRANDLVQILCSDDPTRFHWIPSNSSHLYLLNTDNKMIRGGFEYSHGEVSIGRLKLKEGTIIGKIMLDVIGAADLWFVLNEQEKKAVSYEVLTYKPKKRIMGNGTIIYNFI